MYLVRIATQRKLSNRIPAEYSEYSLLGPLESVPYPARPAFAGMTQDSSEQFMHFEAKSSQTCISKRLEDTLTTVKSLRGLRGGAKKELLAVKSVLLLDICQTNQVGFGHIIIRSFQSFRGGTKTTKK